MQNLILTLDSPDLSDVGRPSQRPQTDELAPGAHALDDKGKCLTCMKQDPTGLCESEDAEPGWRGGL